MTKREKSFFAIAKEVSHFSDFLGPHIGAVVVSGKTILSTGYNSTKTRPLQHRYNIYRHFKDYSTSIASGHAEINALSRLIGKEIEWHKVSIFVYRELKNGRVACARRWKACMTPIRDMGIKEIYYTNEFGDYCKEKVLND